MDSNPIIKELNKLADQLERLQAENYDRRSALRNRSEPGKYDGYTVYAVKETRVRSYIRRGYRAVRLHRK